MVFINFYKSISVYIIYKIDKNKSRLNEYKLTTFVLTTENEKEFRGIINYRLLNLFIQYFRIMVLSTLYNIRANSKRIILTNKLYLLICIMYSIHLSHKKSRNKPNNNNNSIS